MERTSHSPVLSVRSYAFGFCLSVLLTCFSFWITAHAGARAAALIVGAALVQLIAQLVFFLHLGRRGEPRANLGLFMLTAVIIGVLVAGTLWIMSNLAHLHEHADVPYEGGVITPANELD